MSFLFTLKQDKLSEQLPELYEKYEGYIEKAEPMFKLEGVRLEKLNRDLPHNLATYGKYCSDMKQLIKWLENWREQIETKLTKNYTSGARAFGARELASLIAGDKEMVQINELIIEATLIWQKLEAIKEALQQMGWGLSNIVKLRVAELGDVIL